MGLAFNPELAVVLEIETTALKMPVSVFVKLKHAFTLITV
jgi:hypothetical protein